MMEGFWSDGGSWRGEKGWDSRGGEVGGEGRGRYPGWVERREVCRGGCVKCGGGEDCDVVVSGRGR